MKNLKMMGAVAGLPLMFVACQANATVFPDLTITESQSTKFAPGDYLNFKNVSTNDGIIDLTVSGGAGGNGSQVLLPIAPGGSDSYYFGKTPGGAGAEGTATFSYKIFGSDTVYSGKVTDILGFESTSTGNSGTVVAATAVPEPASWLMLLLGFGMLGAVMRGTKRNGQVQPLVA